MPSEFNLTESGVSSHASSFEINTPRYPFVDYPTRGILLAILDWAGDETLPRLSIDSAGMMKLFCF
jgi:hypothetical protein